MMRVTPVIGELYTHHEILTRVKSALVNRNFSLMIVFPTLSLLQTIQAELLNQPDLTGFGGVRFLLFEGFIDEIRERFGLNQKEPTGLQQELIVEKAFRYLEKSGNMHYLNRVPLTDNYRRAVLDGISEWKRSSFPPETFEEWAADKGSKERELAAVYQIYQQLLIENGFTEPDLTLQELQLLRLNGAIPENRAEVILYGYTDLTPLQTDFIKALDWWFDFEAIVDPTPVPGFQQFISRHLNFKISSPKVENKEKYGLNRLKECFWCFNPESIIQATDGSDQSVKIIEAAGNIRQATAIAREISALIRSGDYWAEDFLILSPNPQLFCNTSAPIFQEYRLTINQPPVKLIETTTVVQFLLALQVARNGWLWPDMKALIHRLYHGAEVKDGDYLVLLLSEKFGALSGKKRWLALIENPAWSTELSVDLNLKPLFVVLEWLNNLSDEDSYLSYLKHTILWFREKFSLGIRWFNDPLLIKKQVEAYQIIEEFVGLLEDLTSNLNPELFELNEVVSLDTFEDFLKDFLFKMESRGKPEHDHLIKVIPPREARGLIAKVVFITGLEQGNFPRIYVNDWKIGAQERRELKTLGIELETGEQYQIQEQLAFYWSLQAATERLYLVYQNQDENGQVQNRSVFLNDILKWIPGLSQNIINYPLEPQVCRDFAVCYSEPELKQRWTTCLLSSKLALSDEEIQQCFHLYQQEDFRYLGEQIYQWFYRRKLQLNEPFHDNPKISHFFQEQYHEETIMGITSLEEYRNCPYRYFLKYVLKIRPITVPQLLPENLNLGELLHLVLREFYQKHLGTCLQEEHKDLYWDELAGYFDLHFREWVEHAANDLVKVILTLQEFQLKTTLKKWLQEELRWFQEINNRFYPVLLEFGFGTKSSASSRGLLSSTPFQLEWEQSRAKISGRIDRIDIDKEGNYIVYDYKLGKGPSTKEVMELKRIQIPSYLLAVTQLSNGKLQAAGGCYLGLQEPTRKNGSVWNQESVSLNWRGKSQNLLDYNDWDEWLNQIHTVLVECVEGIRFGYFHPTEDDCLSFCEYSSCCRRHDD